MKSAWVKACLASSKSEAHLYSGCRKILRSQSLTLLGSQVLPDLKMSDAGYTSSKTKSLIRGYINDEARSVAADMWAARVKKGKYGSVGFHCYNHLVKGTSLNASEFLKKKAAGDAVSSKRASVMGPCIQATSLTLIDKKTYAVDFFYRTTELFKKFPADMVFVRDVLLEPFDHGLTLDRMTFHFANVTAHPMYFVTIIPHLTDPVGTLIGLRKHDKYFHDWIVKWTARYVCDEHSRGIAKFAQALRVKKDAHERIKPATMKELRKYLRDNHPGHRSDYEDGDDDQ